MFLRREDRKCGQASASNQSSKMKSIKEMLARLNKEEAQNGELDDRFDELYSEMYLIKDELAEMQKSSISQLDDESLNEMRDVITGLKNHPVEYDDKIVRQLIECIKVISADNIKIYFKDGTVTEMLM